MVGESVTVAVGVAEAVEDEVADAEPVELVVALELAVADEEDVDVGDAAADREAETDGVEERVAVGLPGTTHCTSAKDSSAATELPLHLQAVAPEPEPPAKVVSVSGRAFTSLQGWQEAPATALKRPAPQGAQAVLPEAPPVSEPAAQGAHEAAPASAEKVFGAQSWHEPPKGANWPGAQGAQRPESSEAPAGQDEAEGDGDGLDEGTEERVAVAVAEADDVAVEKDVLVELEEEEEVEEELTVDEEVPVELAVGEEVPVELAVGEEVALPVFEAVGEEVALPVLEAVAVAVGMGTHTVFEVGEHGVCTA